MPTIRPEPDASQIAVFGASHDIHFLSGVARIDDRMYCSFTLLRRAEEARSQIKMGTRAAELIPLETAIDEHEEIDMKATLLIAALSSAWLQAQPVLSPATPKFDVVSIKPCRPGDAAGGDSSPGRLHIGCGILANTDNTGLIQIAYNRYSGGHLNSYGVIPIEGGPDWIHSEAFEIDAKSDGQPSTLMMQGPMMQAILEDRFKLKIHRETRQGPVYELVSGKGSPKLKSLQDGSCTPVFVGRTLPALSSGQHYCRNMVSPHSVEFEGGTLSMFAGLLNLILDRPVIDKTGLTNYFEIHLLFSPDDLAVPRPATASPGVPADSPAPDAPGIFQAVQEQLGSKLVPAKGPVDGLVIDHIERPSKN